MCDVRERVNDRKKQEKELQKIIIAYALSPRTHNNNNTEKRREKKEVANSERDDKGEKDAEKKHV